MSVARLRQNSCRPAALDVLGMMRLLVIGFVAAAALVGCSAYELRGTVIQSSYSSVRVVDQSSSEWQRAKDELGVPGANLHLQLDPNTLKRTTLAQGVSGSAGAFALPVNQVGAGLLQYDAGLYVRAPGFEPAVGLFRLPPAGKRVIVTLAPGQDRDLYERPEDIEDTIDRFWR